MKTKTLVSDGDDNIEQKDAETPPRKKLKLKQARLPFQILTQGVESSTPPFKNNKRKLDSSDDVKVVKVIRHNGPNQLHETKENVCTPSVPSECKKSPDTSSKSLPTHHSTKEVDDIATSSDKTVQKCEAGTSPESENASTSVQNTEMHSGSKSEDEESKDISKSRDVQSDVIIISEEENSSEEIENSVSNVIRDSHENKQIENTEETTFCLHLSDSEHSDAEEPEPQNVCEEIMNKSSPCVKGDSIDNKTSNDTVQISETCATSEDKKSEQATDNSEEVTEKTTIDKPEQCKSDNLKTPKKSPWSFNKNTKNNETTSDEVSPKVRKSSSDNCTPKSERKKETTTPPSSKDSAQTIRKLTPKQLQKQQESAKKKEEKEKQRQEREKKKAEEKEEREKKKAEEKEEKLRQKQEKEEQKKKEKEEKEEQKRKEKEEREEQKKKEKEEKEKKKLMELEMKNGEKKRKEDKRQAEAAAFAGFFLSRKSDTKQVEEPKARVEEHFMPFEVKPDMKLAPNARSSLDKERKQILENAINKQAQESLYLNQLKKKEITPQCSHSTWSVNDLKNEVVILEDDEISGNVANSVFETYPATGQMPRPKLLQFWENRRPPYWGTWRKKSASITPIKPFNKDEKYFDYEVDSDDEWEEEEPGESLHGSDDEKESEDEYEVDNEFFVPHGYLSDEENEEEEVQSPEKMKTKLKFLELEFEEEMKQKTERIKPRIIGCIWIDPKNTDAVGGQLLKLLSPYQAVYQDGPIDTSAPEPISVSGSPESKSNVSSPATSAIKRKKFPEEGIPALIRLIHGNINRREFLIREFIAYWSKEQQKLRGENSVDDSESLQPSTSSPGDIVKRSVSNKIKELATWIVCPDEGPMNGRMCWYVPSETRELHELSDLTLPNTSWTYTIKPKRRESDIQVTSSPANVNESTPKQLITKFTKVMTEEERKKQFTPTGEDGTEIKSGEDGSSQVEKTQRKLVFNSASKGNNPSSSICKVITPSSKGSTPTNTVEQRKRVPILMSVPKGQNIPKSSMVSLMKFIKPQKDGENSKNISKTVENESKNNVGDSENTECITLE